MGKGKKIGIGIGMAIVALFALVILGALGRNPPPTTQIKVPDQQKMAQVNDLTFEIVNATQKDRSITVVVLVSNHGSSLEHADWTDFRLIDSNKNLYEDSRAFPPSIGTLPAYAELAPSASKMLKYVFTVKEGMTINDCRLVVIRDSNNLKYLDLV